MTNRLQINKLITVYSNTQYCTSGKAKCKKTRTI